MSKVHYTTCTCSGLRQSHSAEGTNCVPVDLEVHTAVYCNKFNK